MTTDPAEATASNRSLRRVILIAALLEAAVFLFVITIHLTRTELPK